MEFRYGDPVHPVTPGGAPKPTFHPACLTCGYDLRGSKLDRCPECGNTFVYREWERAVRDVKSRITETEELLWWSNRAWIIAIAGVAMLVVCLIPGVGAAMRIMLRGAALLCGVGGCLSGVNFFRKSRIPEWAAEHLTVQPSFGSAFVGLLGGIAVAILSLIMP